MLIGAASRIRRSSTNCFGSPCNRSSRPTTASCEARARRQTQYFAARDDAAALKTLVDYTIARHYPGAADAERPALTLLQSVIENQARLVARWMNLGFIHGVMNTDNTAVSGETIDFGPCAFLDVYDPATVFSAIDHSGRYAYGNQPGIAQWNLARFAETLLPLIDPQPARAIELATAAVTAFSPLYDDHWLAGMRHKLGARQVVEGQALTRFNPGYTTLR